MADAAEQDKDPPKAKVFISYSRKDVEFANRLDAALKDRGFEPQIDRTEIYAFEEWWKRIEALIAQADTVVFVLSPDSVTSDVALREVSFAASLNKRFAPIVCCRVDDKTVPEALAKLNFIFFDDPARFHESADQLADALNTDIAWVRQHTEYGELARRWVAAGRPGPRGLLLRSPILEQAERWIASRPRGAPAPTEDTQAFIRLSRQEATRRRNILTGSLAAGLLLAIGLAGLAYWQRSIAVEQRDLAEVRRLATLAEVATGEALRENWETSLRLGAHAVRLARVMGGPAGESISGPSAALAAATWQSDWRLTLSGHEGSLRTASFSPDGKQIVTASADKTARIWDAATGQEIAVLRGHQGRVTCAIFSPDGKRIVTGSEDKTARIWDAATAREIMVLRAHEYSVNSAAFSPDGKRILTTAWDGHLWDVATGKEIVVFRKADYATFSPDGTRIVTSSPDNTLHIWDVGTFKEIAIVRGRGTLSGPFSNYGAVIVSSAAFSPDGMRIVWLSSISSDTKTPRIWDTGTGKEIAMLRGHTSDVNFAAFSPDGKRIVTGSEDKTARIWDAATGQEIAVVRGHRGRVLSAIFSPDGKRIVTASEDKTARIWDTGAAKEIAVLRGQDQPMSFAAFSPNGKRLVTVNFMGEARIWDTATLERIATLQGAAFSAEFSPNGKNILTTTVSGVKIWDIANAKEILFFPGNESPGRSAAFSPDGKKLVTASQDETAVRIWDIEAGKEIAVLQGHDASVMEAHFSADGMRIVTVSEDKTGRIWDVGTGKQIAVLRGTDPLSVAFSPDGSRVVMGSGDKTAHIWDAVSFKEIAILRGHEGWVGSASFSADGRRIVTTSEDKTTRIWDAGTFKEIAILRGHEGPVYSAALNPDGTLLVTTSMDKTARIWQVRLAIMPTEDLVKEVCSRPLRGLTKFNRDEMRLAGYSDDMPEIDACAGVE